MQSVGAVFFHAERFWGRGWALAQHGVECRLLEQRTGRAVTAQGWPAKQAVLTVTVRGLPVCAVGGLLGGAERAVLERKQRLQGGKFAKIGF